MNRSKRINRNRPKRKTRNRILIVTEGIKTEVTYIQGLVQHLDATGAKVHATKTRGIGKDPLYVLREAASIQENDQDGFDSTWVLVDVDDHTTLEDCLSEAKKSDIKVVISNPSFEIWLLWHFEDCNKNCNNKYLERRLRDLGHEGKTVTHKFPFEEYESAIVRANSTGKKVFYNKKGKNPSSAMPFLIENLK